MHHILLEMSIQEVKFPTVERLLDNISFISPKKHCLAPQNGFESSRPKNCRKYKTAKIEKSCCEPIE